MKIFYSTLDAKTFCKAGTALTIGNYDGVHLGHRAILKNLKAQAKKRKLKSALLTFEPHPVQVLVPQIAPKLINTLKQKIELLEQTGLDTLIVQSFDMPFAKMKPADFFKKSLVKDLNARFITVGHDFTFGDKKTGTIETLEVFAHEKNIEIDIIEAQMLDQTLVSSSLIRKLIASGDIPFANHLLGRDFFIDGQVVHGHNRGASLGLHTANLHTDNDLLPLDGVYATRFQIGKKKYQSVTNVGFNPTFNNTERSIETHIFDFDRDIYKKEVRLSFVKRLRNEIKFVNPEALVKQIEKDISEAKKVLR